MNISILIPKTQVKPSQTFVCKSRVVFIKPTIGKHTASEFNNDFRNGCCNTTNKSFASNCFGLAIRMCGQVCFGILSLQTRM